MDDAEQTVIDLWVAFDLSTRKIGLDKQLNELRDAKTAAVERRKFLNEVKSFFFIGIH